MNRNLKAALIAIPLTFSLTGCVIVANDDGARADWLGDNSSGWEKTQKENKRKISELEVGASFASVRSELGTPEFNEAYSENGKAYQVLFYRTRHKHSDGQTTKNECTPLIFIDGKLSSWGDKAYNKL